ncbi:MAG: MFS transporter [Anaerolineales bacterium]|nr:MFS transporter [Anaerolineales bacterium]
MEINKKTWRQLSITTVIRTVYSTGFRMVFPYQPILMKGLGIELAQMTRLIAGQSLVGIFSPFLASMADTRGRKTGMLTGMILFCLGSLVVVFQPTVLGFFLFLVLSLLGKSIFDPSIQAYFGDHTPYQRRGFVLAISEMSWSMSFFIGMPVIGFLMSQFGLLAPFLALGVLGVISFLAVIVIIPPDPVLTTERPSLLTNFSLVFRSGPALAGLGVMLLICFANQLINVVFGVWLNESYGLQIAALGGASAVIGISELIGEGGVSLISDRLSKKKAVLFGVIGNILASILLPFLGGTMWGAYLGLFLFYLTFEFTIVSVIPLMTGVLPEARATVMALNIASASLGRGLGSLIAAPLYAGSFGLNAAFAVVVNLLAILSLRYVIVKEEG